MPDFTQECTYSEPGGDGCDRGATHLVEYLQHDEPIAYCEEHAEKAREKFDEYAGMEAI